MTSRDPGPSSVKRGATACRSRRRTRLRVVAPPTALLTTKPTIGAAVTSPDAASPVALPIALPIAGPSATARHREPARRPRRAALKSAPRRMRWLAASIGARVPPPRFRGSGRQPRAALVPASGKDAATGAGAHAQPEAVRLGAAPVVRLERPLAHWSRSQKLYGRQTHGGVVDRLGQIIGSAPIDGPAAPHGAQPTPPRRSRITVRGRQETGQTLDPGCARVVVPTRRETASQFGPLVDNALSRRGCVVTVAADQSIRGAGAPTFGQRHHSPTSSVTLSQVSTGTGAASATLTAASFTAVTACTGCG